MYIFRFRKFKVYKDALIFRRELRRLTKINFPREEQYCLTSQLWRASDSIILNIAEGTDRSTDKDFANFLNKSHTSLNEVVACLDCAQDESYITKADVEYFLKKGAMIADQLTALRKKLLTYPSK